jgi:TctA family transporter
MDFNLNFFWGLITGLIPSLHPNNLVNFVDKENLIPIAILHSFINIIPNVYFLVPDIETITNLNPIYQFYKEGNALKAIQISGLASLLGAFISLIFYYFPFIFLIYKTHFFKFILYINLILLSVIKETFNKSVLTLILLIISFLTLKIYTFFENDYFFLLTGFFGLSSVLTFPKQKIKQKFHFFKGINYKNLIVYSFLGSLLAIPANIFPLITPTHFLIMFSLLLVFDKEKSIIIASSMNTSDFILSVITKEYLGFSRNFVVSNASTIKTEEIIIYSLLSFIILIAFSFLINYIYNIVNRKVLLILILTSIIWPLFLDLSLTKIIFLFISAFLGYLCLKLGIERINLFNAYILNYLIK